MKTITAPLDRRNFIKTTATITTGLLGLSGLNQSLMASEPPTAPLLSTPSGNLATAMRGVWWLLSREDWTKNGQQRIDPTLGADPIGILSYASTHFAAQLMKRNRSDNPANQIFYSGKNNTSAVGGYDAYFGTYEVNEQIGNVAHTLIGSITPSNIGITVLRDLRVNDDKLVIQLETTTPEGEPITRTLVWKRIS